MMEKLLFLIWKNLERRDMQNKLLVLKENQKLDKLIGQIQEEKFMLVMKTVQLQFGQQKRLLLLVRRFWV